MVGGGVRKEHGDDQISGDDAGDMCEELFQF